MLVFLCHVPPLNPAARLQRALVAIGVFSVYNCVFLSQLWFQKSPLQECLNGGLNGVCDTATEKFKQWTCHKCLYDPRTEDDMMLGRQAEYVLRVP